MYSRCSQYKLYDTNCCVTDIGGGKTRSIINTSVHSQHPQSHPIELVPSVQWRIQMVGGSVACSSNELVPSVDLLYSGGYK